MRILRVLLCFGLGAAIASPLRALTAEDAWAAVQAQARGVGLSLDASVRRRDGAALHVAGVFLGPGVPSEGGYPRAILHEIVLTEAADGSVALALPSRMEVVVGDYDRALVLSQRGLAVTLREAEGRLRADFDAGQIRASFGVEGTAEMPDGSFEPGWVTFAAAWERPQGWIGAEADADLPQRLHLTAQNARMETDVFDPTIGESVSMTVRMTELASDLSLGLPSDWDDPARLPRLLGADLVIRAARSVGNVALATRSPETSDVTDFDAEAVVIRAGVIVPRFLLAETFGEDAALVLATALASGGEVHLEVDTGATTGTNRVTGTFPNLLITQVASSSRTALRLDRTKLSVEALQGAGQSIVQLPDTAFPEARLSYGPTVVRASMSTLPSDQPGGVEFLLDLPDLRLNDEVWDFFDRRKAVPRDPLILRLEFGIAGQIGFDRSDLLAMMPMPDFQFEMDRIDLRDLRLAIGGAALSGRGEFTFDPARVDADGFRIPVGTADLTLTGADRLIGAIESTRLVPAATMAEIRDGLREVWPDPGAADDRKGVFELLPDGNATLNGRMLE